MGEALADRHCAPCHGGTPRIGGEEADRLLGQLPGWRLEEGKLKKSFGFPNFVAAVDFVNRITPIAEAEGHHPDLGVGWGRVDVVLWTHAIGGLSENDFVLAAKIDRTDSRST
jgi:4a-hydroxytetrahydrobiopterin dehydratase